MGDNYIPAITEDIIICNTRSQTRLSNWKHCNPVLHLQLPCLCVRLYGSRQCPSIHPQALFLTRKQLSLCALTVPMANRESSVNRNSQGSSGLASPCLWSFLMRDRWLLSVSTSFAHHAFITIMQRLNAKQSNGGGFVTNTLAGKRMARHIEKMAKDSNSHKRL